MVDGLEKTLKDVGKLDNLENRKIIMQFYNHMDKNTEIKDRSKNNNLRHVIYLARWLDKSSLLKVSKKILEDFLNTKKKSEDVDPDEKWKTTYNDYVIRLRHFYRWLHNKSKKDSSDWVTPSIVKIKLKHSNRTSPYSKNNIWTRDEILSILKYEPNLRNKAIITLAWDCDARPHELTKLKIKHINFYAGHAEGEIPFNTKTGGREILLRASFPYTRDWKNQHPRRNNGEAFFFYDEDTGKPIQPATITYIFRQFKKRIERDFNNGSIADPVERQVIEKFLVEKKWNPYCIRHSAITEDGDTLPADAVDKKIGWVAGSPMRRRYMKRSFTRQLKNAILERDGYVIDPDHKTLPAVMPCHSCKKINGFDIEICECGAVLSQTALNKIKQQDEEKINNMVNDRLRDVKKEMMKMMHKQIFHNEFENVIEKLIQEKRALKQYGSISANEQFEYFMESSKAKWMSEDELELLKKMVDSNEILPVGLIPPDEDGEGLDIRPLTKFESKKLVTEIKKLEDSNKISDEQMKEYEESLEENLRIARES